MLIKASTLESLVLRDIGAKKRCKGNALTGWEFPDDDPLMPEFLRLVSERREQYETGKEGKGTERAKKRMEKERRAEEEKNRTEEEREALRWELAPKLAEHIKQYYPNIPDAIVQPIARRKYYLMLIGRELSRQEIKKLVMAHLRQTHTNYREELTEILATFE